MEKQITNKGYYYIKTIALISMLIDHIPKIFGFEDTTIGYGMIAIGRLAFPLFCWELVQCFHYTKNKMNHCINLLSLAVTSEFLYNEVFYKEIFYLKSQNICFELLAGWILLYIWDLPKINKTYDDKQGLCKIYCIINDYLIKIGATTLILIISELLHFNYGFIGILLILIFHLAYKMKYPLILESIGLIGYIIINGFIYFNNIWFSLFIHSFILANIGFIYYFRYIYKGEFKKPLNKPIRMSYRYFYPVHIFILGLISKFL